ncbi:MAG: hypothetical protein NT011_01690 [Kiritimatiellaeota bacterium]|nr:hypothetical protein [Kiritimatiellota bacterium]
MITEKRKTEMGYASSWAELRYLSAIGLGRTSANGLCGIPSIEELKAKGIFAFDPVNDKDKAYAPANDEEREYLQELEKHYQVALDKMIADMDKFLRGDRPTPAAQSPYDSTIIDELMKRWKVLEDKANQRQKALIDKININLAAVNKSVKTVDQRETELTRQVKNTFPQIDADRRKTQLAWIRQINFCSKNETTAAILKTEGLTLSAIATRLPHKNGKPITRQGVKQMLTRFEEKTGKKVFSSGTYRDNARIESEAKESAEGGEDAADS